MTKQMTKHVMNLIPDFTLFPQEAPNWCWPAVVQMLQHHFLPISQSQSDIAAHCHSELGCVTVGPQGGRCDCTHPCLRGLQWQVTRRNHSLAWEQLRREIDAGRPVVVTWGSHIGVCVGYDPVGRLLALYNPLPIGRGRLESLPYHDYEGLFNAQSWFDIQDRSGRQLQ
jgi:hypothetical protein